MTKEPPLYFNIVTGRHEFYNSHACDVINPILVLRSMIKNKVLTNNKALIKEY